MEWFRIALALIVLVAGGAAHAGVRVLPPRPNLALPKVGGVPNMAPYARANLAYNARPRPQVTRATVLEKLNEAGRRGIFAARPDDLSIARGLVRLAGQPGIGEPPEAVDLRLRTLQGAERAAMHELRDIEELLQRAGPEVAPGDRTISRHALDDAWRLLSQAISRVQSVYAGRGGGPLPHGGLSHRFNELLSDLGEPEGRWHTVVTKGVGVNQYEYSSEVSPRAAPGHFVARIEDLVPTMGLDVKLPYDFATVKEAAVQAGRLLEVAWHHLRPSSGLSPELAAFEHQWLREKSLQFPRQLPVSPLFATPALLELGKPWWERSL